jgi:hypothetical protein
MLSFRLQNQTRDETSRIRPAVPVGSSVCQPGEANTFYVLLAESMPCVFLPSRSVRRRQNLSWLGSKVPRSQAVHNQPKCGTFYLRPVHSCARQVQKHVLLLVLIALKGENPLRKNEVSFRQFLIEMSTLLIDN